MGDRQTIDAAIAERMRLRGSHDLDAIARADAVLATAGIKAEDKAGGMVWRPMERKA
jgi:hypothetical protein